MDAKSRPAKTHLAVAEAWVRPELKDIFQKVGLCVGTPRTLLNSSLIDPHLRVTPEKMFEEVGWLKPKITKRAKAEKK